jgi:signal peptidase I
VNRAKVLWIALAAALLLLRVGWAVFSFRQATSRARYTQRARAAETVRTTAMAPTIRVGESVEVEKIEAAGRGDIVMLVEPDTMLRIVGTAGDKIEIRDKRLFRNDEEVQEPYAVHEDTETNAQRDQFGPLIIGNGHYFVLGDNRDHCTDSRYFGAVPAANVKGRITQVMGMGGWRKVSE